MTVVKHGISTDTADRLVIDAGAVYIGLKDATNTGTLLGATKGGNTFEVNRTFRDVRPDGAKGPVKGFRRLDEVSVTLKCNMLELTAENLRRALAGATYASGTTSVESEDCGNGTGSQTEFALDHSPVVENSETIYLEGVEQTRGTDYTMDYANGTIQFVAAPGSGESYTVTADYDYISAAAVINGAEVDDSAYVDNVTIVGTVQGYSNPIICKMTNALAQAPFSLAMAPKDEAVPVVTFEGHYTAAALTTEPWSVEYPAS